MAGKQTAYIKSIPSNVTRLAGLTTTIIGAVGKGRDEDVVGIARGDSEVLAGTFGCHGGPNRLRYQPCAADGWRTNLARGSGHG